VLSGIKGQQTEVFKAVDFGYVMRAYAVVGKGVNLDRWLPDRSGTSLSDGLMAALDMNCSASGGAPFRFFEQAPTVMSPGLMSALDMNCSVPVVAPEFSPTDYVNVARDWVEGIFPLSATPLRDIVHRASGFLEARRNQARIDQLAPPTGYEYNRLGLLFRYNLLKSRLLRGVKIAGVVVVTGLVAWVVVSWLNRTRYRLGLGGGGLSRYELQGTRPEDPADDLPDDDPEICLFADIADLFAEPDEDDAEPMVYERVEVQAPFDHQPMDEFRSLERLADSVLDTQVLDITASVDDHLSLHPIASRDGSDAQASAESADAQALLAWRNAPADERSDKPPKLTAEADWANKVPTVVRDDTWEKLVAHCVVLAKNKFGGCSTTTVEYRPDTRKAVWLYLHRVLTEEHRVIPGHVKRILEIAVPMVFVDTMEETSAKKICDGRVAALSWSRVSFLGGIKRSVVDAVAAIPGLHWTSELLGASRPGGPPR